jgi:hypothetical protein
MNHTEKGDNLNSNTRPLLYPVLYLPENFCTNERSRMYHRTRIPCRESQTSTKQRHSRCYSIQTHTRRKHTQGQTFFPVNEGAKKFETAPGMDRADLRLARGKRFDLPWISQMADLPVSSSHLPLSASLPQRPRSSCVSPSNWVGPV